MSKDVVVPTHRIELIRDTVRRWGLPVAAWLASTLVMWMTAGLSGQDFWAPDARQKWDSEWYLSIATGGYESFRCIDRYPHFPDVWCGNTAWFPGYPVAIRLVAAIGIPAAVAALIVTGACLFASYVLLWRLLDARLTWHSGLAMGLAAVFPGAIYFHVVFPIAMCLLGLLLVVWGVRRESWVLAGIGAFVAFSTHIVGLIGVIALLLSLAFGWRSFPWPGRAWRVGAASALGLLAYPGTLWMIHLGTGSWTIYWEHQAEAFGNAGLHNPITEVVRFWNSPFGSWRPPAPDATWLVAHSTSAHQAQLVINLAFALAIALMALWRFRRNELTSWEAVAVLIALGAVAVPLLTGAWSAWYRHNALMLVALPALRLPRVVWLVIMAVCLVQAVALGGMWFGGSLI